MVVTPVLASLVLAAAAVTTPEYDLVVYGSSPAAISAAIQAKRMGLKAVIVSPETRIGGLTTGGLGQTDIGNKAAFGGLALEFYRDVAAYYRDERNWTRQKREGLEIHCGKRLRRERGKVKVEEVGVGKRIVSFLTEDGVEYRGKMFVDATYEGDLMAAAGVSYTVRRYADKDGYVQNEGDVEVSRRPDGLHDEGTRSQHAEGQRPLSLRLRT